MIRTDININHLNSMFEFGINDCDDYFLVCSYVKGLRSISNLSSNLKSLLNDLLKICSDYEEVHYRYGN